MTAAPCPTVALVRVPASEAVRAAWEREYLSPAEASLVGTRATEKRRAEFVAGRLAAKAAAALLLGPPWSPGDVAVLREGNATTGAPRLALSRWPAGELRTSISHADGLALAAASRERVGIDLVAVEDHGSPFAAEAFAPGELDRWRGSLGSSATADEAVAVAFAAKEAALKWMGAGLTVPLHRVVVLPIGVCAPAREVLAAPSSMRVRVVAPAGGDAFVRLPQVGLQVSVETISPRSRVVLGARVLRVGRRVAFLLWGPEAAPRHHTASARFELASGG